MLLKFVIILIVSDMINHSADKKLKRFLKTVENKNLNDKFAEIT